MLVELKARFDEESNIDWARRAGSEGRARRLRHRRAEDPRKTALVVRREGDGMRKYVHLGTGNYNSSTARIYTDLGLLTCDEAIGDDVVALFNLLTGYGATPRIRQAAGRAAATCARASRS